MSNVLIDIKFEIDDLEMEIEGYEDEHMWREESEPDWDDADDYSAWGEFRTRKNLVKMIMIGYSI